MTTATQHETRTGVHLRGGESWQQLARKYLAAFSGDGARLFIQLFYFYLVANSLSIGEFGLFSTASSAGIVLSRVSGIGFFSPLYRIAAVKPRLVGAYSAGYLAAVMLTAPLVVAAGAAVYWALFSSEMPVATFALIAGSEIFFWRTLEIAIAVNRGLEQFGRASRAIVFGFLMKAVAALWLFVTPGAGLAEWSHIYFVSQAAIAVIGVAVFYPRVRLRFRPDLYRRRLREALSVSGSEILFYAQSELDKLVVLAAGGPVAAGLYAIVMRLVDLTAMPVRTFSTLVVQRLMRRPDMLASVARRALFEAGVFAVSTTALLAMAAVFAIKPDILGANVEKAGGILILALMVPAFRNLIEYQSELLYGRGQTVRRMVNYAVIGAMKAGLLLAVIGAFADPADWLLWTNGVFAALYVTSCILTYPALRKPVRSG